MPWDRNNQVPQKNIINVLSLKNIQCLNSESKLNNYAINYIEVINVSNTSVLNSVSGRFRQFCAEMSILEVCDQMKITTDHY